MLRNLIQQFLSGNRDNRRSNRLRVKHRRLSMEALESRQLLSITLSAGTSIFVPLNGSSSGSASNFSVTVSDYSMLTPVIMPQTNKSLQLNVEINGVSQSMVFQLLDNLAPNTTAYIEALVQSGFYDGLSIYRNGKDSSGNPFVIQGGNDPPTGSIKTDQSSIAEEFNPELQFTSAGILAMARTSTPSSSSTEFFITEEPARFLDYSYTIFGIQTVGSSVIDTIQAMPNQSSTEDSSGIGYLATPLTITSASIFTDVSNGVLELSAPAGVTGTVTVTVTTSDGTNTPTTQSFTVTIQADSASNPTDPFTSATPSAPTSVTYVPPSGASNQITNLDNSAASKALQFQVSGVTSGNVVEVLADGTPIGQATASDTTVIVTTDGSTDLTDGLHTITAIQIAKDQNVSIVESGSSTAANFIADVPSLNASSAIQLTIDTVAPQLAFTQSPTAVVGVPYFCKAAVSQSSGSGITYQLTQSPTGMSIDASTGMITWTPGASQQSPAQVTVQATDSAGNTAQLQYDINVLASNASPVLTAANPSLATTNEDTTVTFNLATFINNDSGTTIITDTDDNAVIGGIALVDATGNGTWQYSLDGTTFSSVGAVSESSALLLPNNAILRYIPDGKNGETSSITYRAWDTTGGANGVRADLSQSGAVGGSTAFSANTDTAALTVTSVNDAPVLTLANPSLGSAAFNVATTISLATFINNGSGTTTISDVDSSPLPGSIALTGTTGYGTWTYSHDGTTFIAVGTVADDSALLLLGNAYLRYTPDGSDTETATITYRAWDTTSGEAATYTDTTTNDGTTAFSTAVDTASLAVVNPNAAPVLTPANPSLGSTTSAAASTINLATFINKGSGTTTITDANSGAATGGIALTGTTGQGTWSYSLDGTTFIAVGTVANSSALLLPESASLRYTPDGTHTETATITYRAWDTTAGQSGAQIDTTTNGDTTAFSTATDTAALTVASGSLSGFVYFDSNNDGLMNTSETRLAGVTVRIYSQNVSGSWTEVSGTSPVQTDAEGSYTFQGLAAGTYQIKVDPSSKVLVGQGTLGTIAGIARGSAGNGKFQIQLGASENGNDYNFCILGLQPALLSLRMFLASTPPMTQVIQNMHVAPEVSLNGVGGTSGYDTTYVTGTTPVTVASSGASISSPDSPTLTSMTITIQNLRDGSAEQLQADTSGTSITSTYADGVLTLSGVADVSTYQTVLRSITYGDTASSPTIAARTISVVVNDGTFSSVAATSSLTLIKGTAPSGYSITANQITLNSTTAASAGFAFTNAEVGATYAYSISSSGGGTPVTGGGAVTSATQNVAGINVSSLTDGTLTFSVTLTNGVGAGQPASATNTLDRVAPSGYSITADQTELSSTTATSAGFTFAGAEVGATYDYIVSSNGGGTPITGSGIITSVTQDVTGINVSSLTDGTLIYYVTLTDPAGNVGTSAIASTVLDRVAPSGYSITTDQQTLDNTTAALASFTFSDAELYAKYTYTVTSSGGQGSVTGNGTISSTTQQVTGINVAMLPNGTLTFSVTLTDAAGNIGSAATSTETLNQTVPAGYTITPDKSALNSTTATSAGFTFAGAEVGATYDYAISSDGGGTPVTGSGTVTSATQDVTGINVSSLPNGTLTFSVKLTNGAGAGEPTTAATSTLNQTAPSGYSITADQTALTATTATAAGFSFAGAEVGATYAYTISSDGGGTPLTGGGTVSSAGQDVTGINVSSLLNGTVTFSVKLTDLAGNTGAAVTATTTLNQ
jgi:large repetitive protein